MTVDKFIIMCHNIYDHIHGKEKIDSIYLMFLQIGTNNIQIILIINHK